MANWLKFCYIFVLLGFKIVAAVQPRVVCYYTNWSVYRPGTAKFSAQNINPYLCTHLIYAFGGFTKDNTLKPFDKYQDIEQGGYAKFTGLKTYNKELKTLLAIGGWNEGSARFSPLVASADRRQKFVKNVIKYLRQNLFDGLDLDWEYPAFRDGGKPRDRENYAKLVQELREEFDRESSKTGRSRLLLTMAVPAGLEYVDKGYDIPKLNQFLDWFNLLSYDYHSAFEPSVNHHAPLYGDNVDDEYNYDSDLNINSTINYYINAGAEREKLVLGIPTYGRSYTLYNPESHEIGSPADGPGEQGDATREKGYLAYYEICQNLQEPDDGWTVVQPDPEKLGPYAYNDNQWVGYDDEDIVRKKSKFVVEQNLGGIMFWSIDNDDFRGLCGGKPYPLIEAAKEALLNNIENSRNVVPSSRNRASFSSSKTRHRGESAVIDVTSAPAARRPSQRTRTTTVATTRQTTTESINFRTTTPQPPTTPDPGSDFKCEEEGFFEHPRDCKKYFWCLEAAGLGIVPHPFTCPSGLYFNKLADSCDFARNVLCSKSKTTTTTSTTSTSKPITTTSKPRDAPEASTVAYRNPFFSRASTTTTTTPAYEEYEYELEEDADPATELDQEDPKVIKELIDLIKKVGGLEELEKQLKFQNDDTVVLVNSKNNDISTTPPSISKSLYERVLNRATINKNVFNGGTQILRTSDTTKDKDTKPKYSSINSRTGPQSAGLDKLPEFEGFLKEKPQYVTLTRNNNRQKVSSSQETDYNEAQESSDGTESSVEEAERPQKTTFKYTSIRRERPTVITQEKTDEEDEEEETTVKPVKRPQYVSFSRQRVRTEEPTTTESVSVAQAAEKPSRNTQRYQSLSRTRYSTTSAPQIEDEIIDDEDEDDDDVQETTESVKQSVSSIDSNLLHSTPVYKTIDRKLSTTVTTTTQDPISSTQDSLNSQSTPFKLDDHLSEISTDSITENIISDSTEQVTVTDIPLSLNEIITEKVQPLYNRLFTQNGTSEDVLSNINDFNNLLSSNEIITQSEKNDTITSNDNNVILKNDIKDSAIPRPFSRPRRPIPTRRVNVETTSEKRFSLNLSESEKVSSNANVLQSRSQTRNRVRDYSNLSSRTSSKTENSETAPETTSRPAFNRGRGTARFRASPTKSGIYDKNLNAASQPSVNEQLINENRLRAINFNRNNQENSATVREEPKILEPKVHNIKIEKSTASIDGRPDRLTFELVAGRKIDFGFSTKRPQSKVSEEISKTEKDSPITRVITGPLSKSPTIPSRKQGTVEEIPLVKTTTKTYSLKEPSINITSYSDKQKLTPISKTEADTTESPNDENTTFDSVTESDSDTTFSPNEEIVQSEGDIGVILRSNYTTRRRPFISRRTEPPKIIEEEQVQEEKVTERPARPRPFKVTTVRPSTEQEKVVEIDEQQFSVRPTFSSRRRPFVTRTRPSVSEEPEILLEENIDQTTSRFSVKSNDVSQVTRSRIRPSISGFRTRQNTRTEGSTTRTSTDTTRSRPSYTRRVTSKIREELDISSKEDDFSNIILSPEEDFEDTTQSVDASETTDTIDLDTTSEVILKLSEIPQSRSVFTTSSPRRRVISARRRPTYQPPASVVPQIEEEEKRQSIFSGRRPPNRFSSRNQIREDTTKATVKTTSQKDIYTKIESEEQDDEDSSVSETTEGVLYTLPVGDEENEAETTDRPPEPVRKRVKVFKSRKETAQEVQVTEEKEKENVTTPAPRVRKTKIIRRPSKFVTEGENNIDTISVVQTTKTPRTRIIRRKKIRTETSPEQVDSIDTVEPSSTTERGTGRRKVLRVLKKNVTLSTSEEPTSEAQSTVRPTRPSRVTYVRKINAGANNENAVVPKTRKTLVRRPISTTTTTTTTTTEIPEESEEEEESEENDEEEEDEEKTSVEHKAVQHKEQLTAIHREKEQHIANQRKEQHRVVQPKPQSSEEQHSDEEDEEDEDEEEEKEEEEEKIHRPVLKYPTRPSFNGGSGRGGPVVTIRRRPFIGSTKSSTVHPASTRFISTKGNVITTRAQRVTIRKQFAGRGKFTKTATTTAPFNTFTPLPEQDTEDLLTTTVDYNEDLAHTEIINNNENVLQELDDKQKKKHPASRPTTTIKPTTLYHIFAEPENNLQNTNDIDNNADEIIKKIEKLVEINRIVEINGREDRRTLSKNRKVKKIDTGDIVLLQAPTLNKVGEFSKLTLVKLARVPEPVTKPPPVTTQKSLFAETVFVETSTIPLEGLFDREKNSWTGSDEDIETSTLAYEQNSDDEETTENIPRAKTTLKLENVSAKNVSLLRPESSEDPLVISIANLDKVFLNKVQNGESSTSRPSPVFIPNKQETETAESSKVNVLLDVSNKKDEEKDLTPTPQRKFNNNNYRRTTVPAKKQQTITEATTAVAAKNNFNRRRKITTDKVQQEITTESERKHQRKSGGATTKKRLTTTETSTNEKSTTANPLFRRRVSTARFKRPVTTTTQKIETPETETEISTTTAKIKVSTTNKDLGTESTIQKITRDNYNQLGESIEEYSRVLPLISNAPLRDESFKSPAKKYKLQKISEVSTKLPSNHKPEFEPYSTTTQKITHQKQYFEQVQINDKNYRQTKTKRPVQVAKPQYEEYFEQQTDKQFYFNPTTAAKSRVESGRFQKPSTFDKIINSNNYFTQSTIKPFGNSDYYDETEDMIIGKLNSQVKVIIHSDGKFPKIECLDGGGSFPHPFSCKQFIQCAHTNSRKLVGYVFNCPKNLSYDPVGRICNWNFTCKM